MPLSKPQDPRWHGPQSKYPTINLLKTTFLIPFTILIIVETTLHRIWYNAYYSTVEYDSSETIAYFFLRLGLSLIPDFLSAISTPVLLSRNALHPVYALTQAVVLCSLYICSLILNVLLVGVQELDMDNVQAWYRLCYAEMGMQGVLVLLWGALVGWGAVAVHAWRWGKVVGKMEGDGEELEGFKRERRDSAGVDGEASVKSCRVFV